MGSYVDSIHITSLVDKVVITGFELNHNNCFLMNQPSDVVAVSTVLEVQMGLRSSGKLLTHASFTNGPKPLKFGETWTLTPVNGKLASCPEFLEMKIYTNLGGLIFSQKTWTWENSPRRNSSASFAT
jgi:hypothetical protein